jgi:hypothetical protein
MSRAVLYKVLYMSKIQRPIQPRKKQKRLHVLAKLRKEIGGNSYLGSQRAAPESLGIPVATCASIESGRKDRRGRIRYPLTEKVARRVSAWTGISPGWLLAGNSDAPPVAIDGTPYSRATFDRIRHARNSPDSINNRSSEYLYWYTALCVRLGRSLLAAADANDYKFAGWKIGELIDQVGKTYPTFEGASIDGKLQDPSRPQFFLQSLQEMMKGKTPQTKVWATIFRRFQHKAYMFATKQVVKQLASKPKAKPAKRKSNRR